VDYANYPQRSRLIVQKDEASAAPRPAGSAVSGIDLALQTLLETLLEQEIPWIEYAGASIWCIKG